MNENIFNSIQEEKNISLAEQIAEQISQLIIERNLTADEKLPNEFELAQYLNVGRGTIREAEKLLISRNILEIRRGKGTYVASHTGQTSDPLGLAYMPDQLQVAKELIEIRLYLEPWIASLAAERASDDDISKLETICRDVEQLIYEGKNHLVRDAELHTAIADCTHNRIMPKFIPIITYSVNLFGTISHHSLLQETIDDHRRIIQAIRAHDPQTAQAAMTDHVLINKHRIETLEHN